MAIRDITKLIVCVLAVAAASWLTYVGKIPGEAGVSIITAVLGYVFGNGHAIFERQKSNGGSEKVNG